MNDYVTDDEQVEKIKQWWKENGSSVIAGLVIGVGGLFGWRYWVDYRDSQAAQASEHFERMVRAIEQGQDDQAMEEARAILDQYGSTAYAAMARLSLARAHVDQGQYDQAADALQALLDERPDLAIEMLARKRLAAVRLQQQRYDDALNVLNVEFPQPYAAGFEELRGDVLAAQGDAAAAREAYQRARLAQPPSADPRLLQQKLDDLGVAAG
jgi:predicted negative regulator of RcsB-dependent stress response